LLKVSGISQFDYDQTVFQVNSIKDDISLLNVQIGKTELKAPFDGVIGLKNISVGRSGYLFHGGCYHPDG